MNNIKVSVICYTYNHVKYIQNALDGFCAQETNFPYVCIIIDDASSDGEQQTIRDYLATNFDTDSHSSLLEETNDYLLQVAPHKNNVNCHFAVYFLKYNHHQIHKRKIQYFEKWLKKSEYHALCEGDDYWIDKEKLQKQVNFMDSYPSYGLCHTMFQSEPIKRLNVHVPQNEKDDYLKDLIQGRYRIGTLTVLYRRAIYDLLPGLWKDQDFLMQDYPQWIEFAATAKIKYLPDCTAIYRILPNSASHSRDVNKEINFILSSYNCACFYNKIYKITDTIDKKRIYNAILKSAMLHRATDIADKYIKESISSKSLSVKGLVFFFATHSNIIFTIINKIYCF